MRVGLLTTWDEKCGIAEYAHNLVASLPEIDFEIYERGRWGKTYSENILHVNHEPGLFGWLTASQVSKMRQEGMKTVLTYHAHKACNNRTEFTNAFDKVVLHDHTPDGFECIPMGTPVVDLSGCKVEEKTVGTCGFPFPWKGFHSVAKAANQLGWKAVIIAPESSHADTFAMKKLCERDCPNIEYITDWLSEEQVVRKLATCEVNIFAYSDGLLGISAAARMGVAAQRPFVLTRSGQFKDLFTYADEIEFVATPDEGSITTGILNAQASGKVPNRILQDTNWISVGQAYLNVYRSLSN